uniref:G protein-coupled receptor n=1 Tax=Haemonchus contortus TaxID=6289 RepID=A0A7I4YTW6_HAECO
MSSDVSTIATRIAVEEPLDIFNETQRKIAVIVYSVVCFFSIILHSLFIMGARKFCGWKANFSFTLLVFVSTLALVHIILLAIASLSALLHLDWVQYQLLWIIFGSLVYAAYFTIALLNLVIALHRLLITIYPLVATTKTGETVGKMTIFVIGMVYVFFVTLLNTECGVCWIDSFMSFMVMGDRDPILFYTINRTSNYLIGIVNFFAYALLLFTLIKKKMLSFARNNELRMTIQVSLMMVGEMLFFLYWEFIDDRAYEAWGMVINEISNLLFYDMLILPYLILNRNIHAELKSKLVFHSK